MLLSSVLALATVTLTATSAVAIPVPQTNGLDVRGFDEGDVEGVHLVRRGRKKRGKGASETPPAPVTGSVTRSDAVGPVPVGPAGPVPSGPVPVGPVPAGSAPPGASMTHPETHPSHGNSHDGPPGSHTEGPHDPAASHAEGHSEHPHDHHNSPVASQPPYAESHHPATPPSSKKLSGLSNLWGKLAKHPVVTSVANHPAVKGLFSSLRLRP